MREIPIEFMEDAEREIRILREAVKHQNSVIARLNRQILGIEVVLANIEELEAKRQKWRELDEDYDKPKNWRGSHLFEMIESENQIYSKRSDRFWKYNEANEIDLNCIGELGISGAYVGDLDRDFEAMKLIKQKQRTKTTIRGISRRVQYRMLMRDLAHTRTKLKRIRLRSQVSSMRRRAPIKIRYRSSDFPPVVL